MSTLTYVYEDSTAVLGPLSRSSEPHAYDLCREHAARLTAPRGWELLRVPGHSEASDDLVALADAVRPRREIPAPSPDARQGTREARGPRDPRADGRARTPGSRPGPEPARHLHVLRSPND